PLQSSVLRLTRIHLVDPVQNSALQVQHMFEPDAPQKVGRSRAARAGLALHHELFVGIELGVAPRHLAERNELGTGNSIDLVLIRLPYVDDPDLVPAVESLFVLDGRDFGRTVSGCGYGLRLGWIDSADLTGVE